MLIESLNKRSLKRERLHQVVLTYVVHLHAGAIYRPLHGAFFRWECFRDRAPHSGVDQRVSCVSGVLCCVVRVCITVLSGSCVAERGSLKRSESAVNKVRQVLEGYFWEVPCPFLDSYVLSMRTEHLWELYLSSSRSTKSQTCRANDGSFPIPLKYIDVVRRTKTVLLESRIGDCWNVDGGRELSGRWTCFTQFSKFDDKPPKGQTWSERRLTRVQATSRPDFLWPDVWSNKSKRLSTKREKASVC